jgi:phosphoglycerol transferase MdoB-like AlkP superfamily enzyme
MTDFTDIFNLKRLLVNEVFGNELLFMLGTCILIFYLCTKFRVGDNATLLLLMIWLIIISAVLSHALLGLILFGIALFFAPRISKLISR